MAEIFLVKIFVYTDGFCYMSEGFPYGLHIVILSGISDIVDFSREYFIKIIVLLHAGSIKVNTGSLKI